MQTSMGCLQSKEEAVKEEPQVFSWDREDRPDPKDFTIANQAGICCGRRPGTVNGQQFVIENCVDCSIYIFDHSAMITIDNCENCKIFIGPVKGSVFIRNSKNLQCLVACQQFRTRDCRKIDTFLLCASDPIIESSAAMRFGCFCCYYPELEDQFVKSGLSFFNNNWSSIYDFTPVQDNQNWSFIPDSVSVESYIQQPHGELFNNMDISYAVTKSVVPITRGKKNARYEDSCLIVFFMHTKQNCKSFLCKLQEHMDFDLVQTKEVKMSLDDANRIFKNEIYCKLVEQGPLVGMELSGTNVIKSCETVLCELDITFSDVFMTREEKYAKLDIDAFYNFVDMVMN